jgi:hypothetical protein
MPINIMTDIRQNDTDNRNYSNSMPGLSFALELIKLSVALLTVKILTVIKLSGHNAECRHA